MNDPITAERPLTPFSHLFFRTALGAKFVFGFALPLTLTTIHRMISDGVRGRIYGGPASSHQAIAGIWHSRIPGSPSAWSAVWSAIDEGHHPNL